MSASIDSASRELIPAARHPGGLEGELLIAERVRVVALLHPLQGERVVTELPAGLSVAEMVERVYAGRRLSRLSDYLVATLEGDPLPRERWARIRPKAGTILVLRPVPKGGRGIFQIFIAIAAIAASIFLPPVWGAVAALAIGLVGNFLLNALFPVRPPRIERGDQREVYSIAGVRNEADPFGPVPVVLGRHRVWPRFGARPYTEILGPDQYLRALFVWGYGPLDIEDIKIGETPIGDFDDVEIETFQGYPEDDTPTLYPSQVIQEDLSINLTAEEFGGPNEWFQRTTATDVVEIAVDFVAPRGLLIITRSGDRFDQSIELDIDYRPVGGGAWTRLAREEFLGKTENPVRYGRRWTVAEGQYEVRVRHLRDPEPGDDVVVLDSITWTALRGYRDEAPVSFAQPVAMTAIRIRASDQLNGVIETLNGVCTSRVTAFNGSDWDEDTPSQNPADLFRWVLQSPANARPLSDAQIDLASLQDWWQWCDEEGFAFNQVRTQRGSVMDALADIAAAARASPNVIDGKQGVIFDQPDAPIVQHFTPRNAWGFRADRSYRHWPHAFRVRFSNEEQGWYEDERVVYDDGYDQGSATRYESIEFPGATDPEQNWRLARFHIAQARLRPERYSLATDFENLACTRGDRVRVVYDVPGFGILGARVKSVVDGMPQTVTLDEQVTQEGGGSYTVRFRLADGSSLLRSVTTVAGRGRTLRLTGNGDLPAVGDLALFGEATSESVVLRVYAIEPEDDFAARLTLVDDAPEISQADEGEIPAFDSQITVPPDPFALPPVDVRARELVVLGNDGQPREAAVVSWQVPRFGRSLSFQVQYSSTSLTGPWLAAGNAPAPQTSLEVHNLDTQTYWFRVRALFENGPVGGGGASGWAVSEPVDLLTLLERPPGVQDFRMSVLGGIATLTWARVASIALSHYQIKYSPLTSGATWGSSTTLLNNVTGTSVQVPARAGTYLIKAVALQGLDSESPAIIESNIAVLENLNVVEVLEEDPGFLGEKDDVVVDAELAALRLVYVSTESSGAGSGLGSGPGSGSGADLQPVAEGTYWFAERVDLGAVYTSRVKGLVAAYGLNVGDDFFEPADFFAQADVFNVDPSQWLVVQEIRFTDDDPDDSGAVWSDWQELVESDYTARAFESRLYLASLQAGVTPIVTMLGLEVDMPDRVEGAEDLVVTVAGRRVDFDPPFTALRGLAIAAQDLATGDRGAITNKDETGFDIAFFDSGGSPVERTFDYVAKGYGRRVSE